MSTINVPVWIILEANKTGRLKIFSKFLKFYHLFGSVEFNLLHNKRKYASRLGISYKTLMRQLRRLQQMRWCVFYDKYRVQLTHITHVVGHKSWKSTKMIARVNMGSKDLLSELRAIILKRKLNSQQFKIATKKSGLLITDFSKIYDYRVDPQTSMSRMGIAKLFGMKTAESGSRIMDGLKKIGAVVEDRSRYEPIVLPILVSCFKRGDIYYRRLPNAISIKQYP